MTQGVFEHAGKRYILVPRKRLIAGSYWPGGPSLANPVDRNGVVIDPAGRPIDNATAILEDDLWTAGQIVATVRNWPVYPFSSGLLEKLPAALMDRLVEATVIHSPNSEGEISVETVWDQLRIFRVFKLVQLGAGVAVWPPRALPDWKYFHFLLAAGEKRLIENRTEVFGDLVPIVYGYRDGIPRRGETQVTRVRDAAFSRIDTPPRWITFVSTGDLTRSHGILPVRLTPTGEIAMPDKSARGRSSFAMPIAARRLAATQSVIRLSVDFGTSNSAVAVRAANATTELLPFDSGIRAVNLTKAVGLDPTLKSEYANRFFAVQSTYPNPLPTLLFESPDVDAFSDSDAVPVRGIPEFSGFAPEMIQVFAAEGFLKQDFKWKPSSESAIHRRAYLEQLATIVAWVLRTNKSYEQQSQVDVIFSCPLAFTPGQTTRFKSTIEAFVEALRTCGLAPQPLNPLVSESLANLCFVRENRPTGRLTDSERHVVVDIGGGTTDLSVFTGKGQTVLLDSLYVGGKDIAGSLLYYRIARQNGWQPVAKALGLNENNSPERRGQEVWVEMAQCLLINRMATNIDRLADDLSHDMPDLLAEMLTLLTFVSLYAVRMAAVAVADLPKANTIHVWFAGLGSRLFKLAPLAARQMNREDSARKILQRAVQECSELNQVEVTFHLGSYSKESVCRGSLLTEAEKGLGHELSVSTLMWADVPSAGIAWSNPYGVKKVEALTAAQIDDLQTKQLDECYAIAVQIVGELTLDKFRLESDALAKSAREISDAFARGCDAIQKGGDEAPRHPVREVTQMLKENVCELLD